MLDATGNGEIIFEVKTPLGFSVRSTAGHWQTIVSMKHPIMRGREQEVKRALSEPEEIRVSKSDNHVYLFYLSDGVKRWICAVVRRLNGDGYLITAYRTSNIKEGVLVWPK